MTDSQLACMEERAEGIGSEGLGLVRSDMRTLIAEVRRLRAENAELLALLGDRVQDSDIAREAVRREMLRCVGVLADLMEREDDMAEARREGGMVEVRQVHSFAARRLAHAGCVIAKPQPAPTLPANQGPSRPSSPQGE